MKKIRSKISTIFIIFLFLYLLFQIFSRVVHNQLYFDEGYNLQISQNFKTTQQYATYDGLFDVNITTGPTVLLPSALLYSSSHPTFPRIIVALYAIIFLLYVCTIYYSNFAEKMLYVFLISVTPLFFLFASSILGEMPGFIFIFFSYIAFSRSKFLYSGILLSLSILTKNVYVIAIAPIIFYAAYCWWTQKNKTIYFKKLLFFGIGIFLPLFLWEFYKLFAFHFDFKTYLHYSDSTRSFVQSRGGIQMQDIEKRFSMIAYTLHVGGSLFVFFSMFISGYVFIKSKKLETRLLSIFTVVYLIYFICFGSTIWYRHMFPAVLSLLLITPEFILSFYSGLHVERKLLLYSFMIILVISGINYVYRDQNLIFSKQLTEQSLLFLDQTNKPFIHPKKLLIDQYDISQFIRKNIAADERISGFAWLNSPEIAYMTERKIYRDPEEKTIDYVLSSIYDRILDPDSPEKLSQLPLQKVYSNDNYTLYRKSPTIFSKKF